MSKKPNHLKLIQGGGEEPTDHERLPVRRFKAFTAESPLKEIVDAAMARREAELDRMLTPEGRVKLEQAESDFERQFLFGCGSGGQGGTISTFTLDGSTFPGIVNISYGTGYDNGGDAA